MIRAIITKEHKTKYLKFQCQNVQYSVCLHDRGASFGQPIGVATCFRQVRFTEEN